MTLAARIKAAAAVQPSGGTQRRYAAVAAELEAEILSGRRPVGAMLPTEGELCRAYGVSRSTVREALRRLRDMGLVCAAHGIGTKIVSDQPRGDYVLAARSVAELMGYAGQTRLDITQRRTVHATGSLAARLGCTPGSTWRQVAGVRRTEPGGAAISCVDLFIAEEFADIAASPALVSTAAYRLISQRCEIEVVEVRQEIAAVALTGAQAAVLGAEPGGPGLHIRRRFFASGGRLLETTLNVHAAADRFTYSLRLGGPAPPSHPAEAAAVQAAPPAIAAEARTAPGPPPAGPAPGQGISRPAPRR